MIGFFKTKNEKNQEESFDVKFLKNNFRQNSKVTDIECIEARQCYDTTWLVRFVNDGMEQVAKIVRHDTETKEYLCYALDNLSVFTKDTIMSLDKKSVIYYD